MGKTTGLSMRHSLRTAGQTKRVRKCDVDKDDDVTQMTQEQHEAADVAAENARAEAAAVEEDNFLEEDIVEEVIRVATTANSAAPTKVVSPFKGLLRDDAFTTEEANHIFLMFQFRESLTIKRTTDKTSRWKVIVLEEGEKPKYNVPFLTFKTRVKQTEDGLMELRTSGKTYACADLYETHQQRVKFQKGN